MGNSYSDVFFKELKQYIKPIQVIKKVCLNDIFTTRKDDILDSLTHINEAFQNKGIVLFDLSNNAICPDGCEKIKEIFTTNQTLKYLYLNHSALSQAGSITISKYIIEAGL